MFDYSVTPNGKTAVLLGRPMAQGGLGLYISRLLAHTRLGSLRCHLLCQRSRMEEALSRPTEAVIESLRHLDGDLVLHGVAGKMGPTLARMARRALDAAGKKNRVIGVARFSAGGQNETPSRRRRTTALRLLDEEQVARLPDASHVVMMTGYKFGTVGNSSMTWAVNDYAPMLMASRYRHSRSWLFQLATFIP